MIALAPIAALVTLSFSQTAIPEKGQGRKGAEATPQIDAPSAKPTTGYNPPLIPFLDWYVPNAQEALRTGRASLKNKLYGFLNYGSRTWGVNLVFEQSQPKIGLIFEEKLYGNAKPSAGIPLGKELAIKFPNGQYLKYESRNFGVNLGWSSKPVYEWMLISFGEVGTPATLASVGLLNFRENDFLVGQNRTVGVSLGWYKSKYGESTFKPALRTMVAHLRARNCSEMAKFLEYRFRL